MACRGSIIMGTMVYTRNILVGKTIAGRGKMVEEIIMCREIMIAVMVALGSTAVGPPSAEAV